MIILLAMIILLDPQEISLFNVLNASGFNPLAIDLQMLIMCQRQYMAMPVPQAPVEEPQEESPVEEPIEGE